jgi:hypothetical protein
VEHGERTTRARARRGAIPALAVGDYPAAFSPAQAAADTALPVPVGQQVATQPAAAPAPAALPHAALPPPARAAAGLHSGATLSWQWTRRRSVSRAWPAVRVGWTMGPGP